MKRLFKVKKHEVEKKNIKPIIFKEYDMSKLMLPSSFDILIPENDIVRKVNEIVEKLDLTNVYEKYKGGGTSSYHPKMLLKVLIYAYLRNIYSGREIENLLEENIKYMWLAAGNHPDFRTINRFRSETLKDEIDEIFTDVLIQMIDDGHINTNNYFLDGTKIEADANKYSFVWSKSTKRYSKNLQVKIINLLTEINEVVSEENKEAELSNLVNNIPEEIHSNDLRKVVKDIDEELKKSPNNKKLKKAKKELESDIIPRAEKYEEYGEIAGNRNSFSKTDNDATFMRMKEDHMKNGQLKAGYNLQIGTSDQFILGYSIHQKPGDSTCLIPNLKKFINLTGITPENVVTDAGYGSEENYDYLSDLKVRAFVKYNMYHKEETKKYKEDIFKSANFPYDEEKDEFTCPSGKKMRFKNKTIKTSENGYLSEIYYYECENCSGCELKDKCTKSKKNRIIQVNFELKKKRKNAKHLLDSEEGTKLKKQRSIDVEPVFGMIKHNRNFKRFVLRSLKKVNVEWGLICIAHNIKKLHKLVINMENINTNIAEIAKNISFS